MNKIALDNTQWGYIADYFGYQITYRGKGVGGAGTLKREKRLQKNLQYFQEQAIKTVAALSSGGPVPVHMHEEALAIEAKFQTEAKEFVCSLEITIKAPDAHQALANFVKHLKHNEVHVDVVEVGEEGAEKQSIFKTLVLP